MDKIITIYSGDEHRAKMEKQFSRTDMFAEVYSKAYKLVVQIENEMKRYNENNKNRLARYQGMGNNMVIFCGGRGQGKTSVMQSFAKCLDGSYKSERKIEEHEMLEFVSEIRNNKYEVVDSIDPSAMENGESILRVLISRLFFKMEEYVGSESCMSKDDKDFLQNKKKIVELFEKCYTNIECIKNGKRADCGQDDLQKLSQMGSSAKLKENLYELIRTYLMMMADGGKAGGENSRYLVIPIDDADLATKRLFRLCEDIRNYLSVPNVILLMAVDYEQLVHATYQRYLKQYKVMRKSDALLGNKKYVDEECHKMAAKYLEKVFPIMHRIDLPQIDALLTEGYENIKFDYRHLGENQKDKPVFEGMALEQCGNLQEQLLKVLYSRTGLVFSTQNQRLHPFMPHTLRELTHWVKMLHDMHEIDCDTDVYLKYQTSEYMTEALQEKILQLKENILTVKQYFVSYWCEKYLNISAARAIQKVDSVAIRQLAEAGNDAEDGWDKAPAAARMIYREATHNTTFEEDEPFREAVCIYNTIFMNEWFALALKDSAQFKRIVQFAGRTVNLAGCFSEADKYLGRYSTIQFDIDAVNLGETFIFGIDPAIDRCLKSFCVVKQDDKVEESVMISTERGRVIKINPEIRTLEFDILRPVIAQLRENVRDFDKSANEKVRAENAEMGNTDKIRVPYLVTVRNIIANYDVQMQLRNIVVSWNEANNRDTNFVYLSLQVLDLYEEIRTKLITPQSESEDNITGICAKATEQNEDTIDICFLCNYENCEEYIEQVTDELETCCGFAEMDAESLDNDIETDDADRLADAQNLIERLLGELERALDKIEPQQQWVEGIASSSGLDEKWSKLDSACDNAYELRDQLQEQKKRVDERLASIVAKSNETEENTQETDDEEL